MNDLQIARELRSSAARLRSKGWTQGKYGVADGPSCLIGAIVGSRGFRSVEQAERDGNDIGDWASLAAMFPEKEGNSRESAILLWNDEPGRTVAEVLDRLESTALALEVRALAAESVSANPELPVVAETPSFAKVGV